MPTPVALARQCLTQEAAAALDEAVAVARRRGHSQTTSLHVVSAVLSSSLLRDACLRARNAAFYPTRIQIKALELSLGVALDRQPPGQRKRPDDADADPPPVSNSLMAAIKRSQANQRRQPESFHLYHQMQQQQQQQQPQAAAAAAAAAVSCVKVEMKHLILAILDDPVVSRVFAEAGFRSSDVKLAIVRPLLPQFPRYPRARGTPVFLCNSGQDPDPVSRAFAFPFLGFPVAGDGDSRRIGEILARSKGRNPLLVGVSASAALRSFSEAVEGRNYGVLPLEISGLSIVCVEDEVLSFVSGNCDERFVGLRFEEVGRMAEDCLRPGLVVNYGELKVFIGDGGTGTAATDAMTYVVGQLTRLLKVHGRKIWLLGAAESYETYLMFLSRFPSIERDWDLQLMHIASPRSSLGQPFTRSSLMESFVPFGGFFPALSDLKGPLSSSYQCLSRCHLCNEKCEQELSALSKGVFASSLADQYQSSLPSWLHMAEFGMNEGLDVMQVGDDGLVLNAKVAGLQKKWDIICQHLHAQPGPKKHVYQFTSQAIEFVEDEKKNPDHHSGGNLNCSSSESRSENVITEKILTSNSSATNPLICEAKDGNIPSKTWKEPARAENYESVGLGSPWDISNSSVRNGGASLSSINSVTTDLGLGISATSATECKKHLKPAHFELVQDFSGCISTNADLSTASVSHHQSMSSSCSCLDFCGKYNARDFKTIYKTLAVQIGWQIEAIRIISQALSHCQPSRVKCQETYRKREIWFNFLGPDRFGKKKVAVALAELLHGSRENFISVNLGSVDGSWTTHTNPFYCQDRNGHNVKPRGNTIVDYIATELGKKPSSIVFLENVDEADVLAQNSLSYAIRTGKFPNSYGREIGSNNAIFITTSRFSRVTDCLSSEMEDISYSEARIMRAKSWSMQIVIGRAIRNNKRSHNSSIVNTSTGGIPHQILMNKRKLMGCNIPLEPGGSGEMAKRVHKASQKHLDLNLPAEETDVEDIGHRESESGSISESSRSWLKEFLGLVDETVTFEPFDFDALAERILKNINEQFHKIVGPESLLEIDAKVLEQMVAVECLSNKDSVVEDWVEHILSKGFVEAQEKYNLPSNTVMKLVACDGTCSEDQAAEVCLPTKVILNPSPLDACSFSFCD